MFSRFADISFLDLMARAIVLFSAMPIHEFAHGMVANKLGDDTPYHQGRLTLNPFAHLDPFGSILLLMAGFGWAKPVQVDTRNFKKPRRDMALTSLAGPGANVMLALIVMIVMKVMLKLGFPFNVLDWRTAGMVLYMLDIMILLNLFLAVFNLLPVPPLDGFKIFGAIIPDKYYFWVLQNERYIAGIVFILIFTGLLSTPIQFLAYKLYDFINFITRPIAYL